MTLGLSIAHIGLHVRNIEEELEFLALLGGEMTSMDRMKSGTRIAFVSLDGDRHHNLALFEDGAHLDSGDSRREKHGIHHIAMPTDSRESVDRWHRKLLDAGLAIDGPSIQGPEGDGLTGGSGSYAIFFKDPNGVCFEIYTGAMSVEDYRRLQEKGERVLSYA